MGCDSSESNFNNRVWHNNQWYCRSGWDYSYIGPLWALKEKLGDIVTVDGRKGFRVGSSSYSLLWVKDAIWEAVPNRVS